MTNYKHAKGLRKFNMADPIRQTKHFVLLNFVKNWYQGVFASLSRFNQIWVTMFFLFAVKLSSFIVFI